MSSDILYQRRIKEAAQADQLMKRLHIATPIVSDDFDDSVDQLQSINEENEELIIVSDDDDNSKSNYNKEKEDEGGPIV